MRFFENLAPSGEPCRGETARPAAHLQQLQTSKGKPVNNKPDNRDSMEYDMLLYGDQGKITALKKTWSMAEQTVERLVAKGIKA